MNKIYSFRYRLVIALMIAAILLPGRFNAQADARNDDRNSDHQTADRKSNEKTASYLLVLCREDNILTIIEPTKLQVLGRVPTGEGPHEVIASADGKLAYVANYGTKEKLGNSLSIIDIAAQKELKRVELGALMRPHGLAEAGGNIYFTAEVNKQIARYNPVTNSVDWKAATDQQGTHMLAISNDQKHIYTANIFSGNVTAIDLTAANAAPVQIAVDKEPEGIALSPDGRNLWIGHRVGGQVSVIDTTTNKVKESFKVGSLPLRMRFTPDGKRVLIIDPYGNALFVYDAVTCKEIKRIEIAGAPVGVVVTPDGKQAFVSAIEASKVTAIDMEKLTIIGEVPIIKGSDGMAWAGK